MDSDDKVLVIIVLAILSVSVFFMIFADPRESAMKNCIGGSSSQEHRLACAKEIYGVNA